MKTKILLFGLLSFSGLLFIIIYLEACKHENANDINNLINDPMFVSIETCNKVAQNINKHDVVLKTLDSKELKSVKYLGIRKIKNRITISDKLKVPYFYAYNYDSGGFVIISADKRLRPIMVYSDLGSFKTDSLPLGVVLWLDQNASIIKELRKTNDKPDTFITREWATMTACPPEPEPLSASRLKIAPCKDEPLPTDPDQCNTPSTITTVGPLLTTTWGQGCGYNSNCPVAFDGPCGYCVTGCVATSMAQVMYYWKYPDSFNWSKMATNYGTSESARLMSAIGKAVGMSYSATLSSASGSNIGGSLVGVFGYNSARYVSKYDAGSYILIKENYFGRQTRNSGRM